jgi:hypothetical protein
MCSCCVKEVSYTFCNTLDMHCCFAERAIHPSLDRQDTQAPVLVVIIYMYYDTQDRQDTQAPTWSCFHYLHVL